MVLPRAVCLYNQSVSDATIKASDKGDIKGGFTSAVLLSSQRELMCVTGDQRLLFYESVALENGEIALKLVKQLIGNNEEIIDLKFVGEGDRSLAVATNLEQVNLKPSSNQYCWLDAKMELICIGCLLLLLKPQSSCHGWGRCECMT